MLSGMGKNSTWLKIPLLCLENIVMDLWLSSMEESAFTRGLVTSRDCFSLCGVWHWLYLPIWCNFWFLPQIPREGNSQRTLLCQLLPSHLSWRFELSMLVIVIVCDFLRAPLRLPVPQTTCTPYIAVNAGEGPLRNPWHCQMGPKSFLTLPPEVNCQSLLLLPFPASSFTLGYLHSLEAH